MKCRDISIFCGLLLLLALTGAQAGCASKTQPQQTPLPTAKLTAMPNDGGMLSANTRAADQLASILAGRMETAYGILTTSLVNMDDLAEAPHFGRMLMQQISSRLSQHGFKMIEARLADTMIINKQGEFMLSREAGARLAKEYSAYAVLVGLYSRVGNHLYISTRVLRLGDSAVLAAYEYSLPESLITPGTPIVASGVAALAAAPAPVAPGVVITPSSLPAPAPKPVQPVVVPVQSAAMPVQPAAVPVTGAASYANKGVDSEDALWQRYSKRGQAFEHCVEPAPAQQIVTPPRRNAGITAKPGKAAVKPVAKPAAKPVAKPVAPMEDLLGKEPLCPPGCVPANSRNATAAPDLGQKTAPVSPSRDTAYPVTPPPATIQGTPAPVVVTPQTATTTATRLEPVNPAPASPAPTSQEPASPAPASPEPVSPEPVSPAPAPLVDSASSAEPSPADAPAPPAQDGSESVPAPAAGTPPPAASQLGRLGQPGT